MNRKRLTAAAAALVLGVAGVVMLAPSAASASGSDAAGQPSVHDGATADWSGLVSDLAPHGAELTAEDVARIKSGLTERNAGMSQEDLHEGAPAGAVDVDPAG